MDEPTYRELTAEFTDFEERRVEKAFHFRKPGADVIGRAMKEIGKDTLRGMRNLCMSLVKPEQRDDLKQAVEDYPGLAGKFANTLLEAVGFDALGK